MAVVDHAHRLAQPLRQQRGMHARSSTGTLPCRRNPRPSRPASMTACSLVRLSARCSRLVDVVRALHRAVDGDPAIRPGHRDHRLVLDVQLLLVADAVLALDDQVGLREAALDVDPWPREVGELLLRLTADRRPPAAALVRSLRCACACAERLAVRRREQRNRLGVVADLVLDQHRLVVVDEADDVVAGDVACRQHDAPSTNRTRDRARSRGVAHGRLSNGRCGRTRRRGTPGRRCTAPSR